MFKKTLTSLILTLVAFGGFFGVSIHDSSYKNEQSSIIHIPGANASAIDEGEGYCPSGNCGKITPDTKMQEMLDALVGAINILLSILTIIVSPAIMLASWLMTPDWTAGDIFGLRPVLHNLWITVSNITYFIYAVLLIVIALATIFNSEHYGYKQLLPKLALGIILVPMTWWGVQFTISLATYVTASAISLPAESIKKFSSDGSWWNTYSIPREIVYKNQNNMAGNYNLSSKTGSTVEYCQIDGGENKKGNQDKCTSPEELMDKSTGLFSPLLIYSFGVFKIQNVKLIDTSPQYAIKSIIDIVHQGIIGALMFIVYGILVIALIFMLVMRAMKLWFYAIFSPLFTIKYVLGDKAFGDGDKDGSLNITQFIGLAFVPAVVSLALSFGLVIITALYSPLSGDGVNSNPNNKCENDVCTIRIMGSDDMTIISQKDGNETKTTITAGTFKYTFYGSVQGGEKIVPGISSALSATGNLFGTIIIDIIALVFIFIAFMAGKGVSKAAGKAMEPFENLGKKIGGMAASAPQYMPIPGTGGLSIKGAGKVMDNAETFMAAKHDKDLKSKPWGKMFGGENIVGEAQEKIVAGNLSQANNPNSEKYKEVEKVLRESSTKEIEYSTIFKDIANHLKEKYGEDRNKKIEALGKMGYSQDNAKIILDRLEKNNGVYNKDDRELVAKLKSLGGSNSASNSNNSINITVNGGDKFTFEGSGFNLKDKTKEDIYTELMKFPEKLKGMDNKDITEKLQTLKIDKDKIDALLKKIEDERKKSSDTSKAE